VVFCIHGTSREVAWRFETAGGKANCNNVSSPALAGRFLHVGTMGGRYYVLDCANGTVIKEIICGEPIWSTPVVVNDRVYFATLGSKVYCLKPDGSILWTWDFVREVLKFTGDRWSGEQWHRHKEGRVTRRDQFLCMQDITAYNDLIIVPVGGSALVLQDLGTRAEVRVRKPMPPYNGSENPALFGMSVAEAGPSSSKGTGTILSSFDMGYACTRFTLSEPYLVGCNMDLINTTNGVQLACSGPCLEPRECVGAAVSNGRIFYTAQASGMQACAIYGEEANQVKSSWE
jgi:hypothetical protein